MHMSQIVIVNGSPRKNGNCVALTGAMKAKLEAAGNDVTVFNINELESYKACQACMACKKSGKCVRKDDMTPVIDAVKEADGIIVATPTYFGHATAQYRAFEDRMYCCIGADFALQIPEGKKCGVIVTCGGGVDGAVAMSKQIEGVMGGFFKMNLLGTYVFSEAAAGKPARDDADAIAAAEKIAEAF